MHANYELENEVIDDRLLDLAERVAASIYGDSILENHPDKNAVIDEVYLWLYEGDNESLTVDDIDSITAEFKQYYGME